MHELSWLYDTNTFGATRLDGLRFDPIQRDAQRRGITPRNQLKERAVQGKKGGGGGNVQQAFLGTMYRSHPRCYLVAFPGTAPR